MAQRTPLYDEHIALNARMVDFGGWDMPINYGSQIEEHHYVRRAAGIFDVSHMTVVDFKGTQVGDYLRKLLANDVSRLKAEGKALYSCMLNHDGGVIDDLIVYYMNDNWFRMVVNASTDDLGTMLAGLGYSAIISNGKAKAVMQADWYDSPNRFDLSKLNGTLGVIIDDGLIRDIQPGAGRMLGLLSIAELPRRIIGDFGELRKGFKFGQIYGQFDIENGDANTDNLRVVSPIALISIYGRTGLAKRDFNQHVTVVPNVSGTVPIISWLAWGSQIGAVTFLLDQLFGEQVDESAATKYHITGSWEKPNIEKLEPDPLGTLEESKSEETEQ